MEAQRSEVTQLRSHSEQVPGPRSFLLLFHPHQARYPHSDLIQTLRTQCVNDLNRELNGSLKKQSFLHYSLLILSGKNSPLPKRYLCSISQSVFICHLQIVLFLD